MSATQVATIATRWVVAQKNGWITATAQRFPGYTKLSVYRSIRARDHQSWMSPVVGMMKNRCVAWTEAVRVPDRSMVGHAAWDLAFHVFDTCPGSRVPHDCEMEANGNRHREAVSIGQSVEGVATMPLPVVPRPREAG